MEYIPLPKSPVAWAVRLTDAGLTALRDLGATVRWSGAPLRADGARLAETTVDESAVRQQDWQAVGNGLWAGGAEAMMVEGVRGGRHVKTVGGVPGSGGSAGQSPARASG